MTYRKLEDLSVELELTANLRPIGDGTVGKKPPTIRHLFDDRDVVRHPLVQQIIKAYESYQNGDG